MRLSVGQAEYPVRETSEVRQQKREAREKTMLDSGLIRFRRTREKHHRRQPELIPGRISVDRKNAPGTDRTYERRLFVTRRNCTRPGLSLTGIHSDFIVRHKVCVHNFNFVKYC